MTTNLLPISSDGGFVSGGNITTASYASPAPTLSGFSTVSAENIRLMNGNITGGLATVVDDGINSIALAFGAQMDVFGFPFSQTTRGQLTISDVTTPNEVNGTWYYQSVNTNAYQIYTDNTYATLVDATGWSAYTGGGNVAIVKQVPAANIVIDSNGFLTKFDNTGNLTFPDNTIQSTAWTGNVAGANVTGTVGNANLSQYLAVSDVNNNFSYHVVLSAGSGDKSLHIDADDNLQYNPADGTLTSTRVDATYALANLYYANGYLASNLVGSVSNIANGNSNVVVNANSNVIISTNGNASVLDIGADGRVRMINGPKVIGGNIVAGEGYVQFAASALTYFAGNVQLLAGGYIKGPGGVNVIQLNSPENGSARISNNFAVGSSNTGNITGGNITLSGNISGNTNGFAIGYLNIPQVSASNTTLAATDAGKHYYSTTAGNLTLTIPNNATTSFATGTAISIVVQAAGNILVNAASGVTLYMAGNSTSANRVVGTYGMATLMKVASDTWFINGTGVS